MFLSFSEREDSKLAFACVEQEVRDFVAEFRISERNAKKKPKFLLSLPHSRENGYVAEVVAEGARYDYLVRLTKK